MKAYHHIALHPDSQPLTPDHDPPGTLLICEDALGIFKDSGTMFQRCRWEMLEDYPGSVPYIDDILVYGKTKQEHDQNLEPVLRALHACNFCRQLSKCQFRQKTVKYLGHILSGTELWLNPDTMAMMEKAPAPQNPLQLSSFLALVGFYTNFLHGLAMKAEPL